ncbi:MAG: UDPGP type 1 family protein [Planctomycetaceae bacterium]|nr:UDPGP type 1 family protein [Planctomycetaceae bacterium]MBT6485812.1 UDPGP type 1 family protein [Planctomycetaceae bacterium]
MPSPPPAELVQRLTQHDQQHLLDSWDKLNPSEREVFLAQLSALDFAEIGSLLAETGTTSADEKPEARARRAAQPRKLVRLPNSPQEMAERHEASRQGEQLLADGKVGIILVAGGQGSRLGFDHPKGMFPIGPVSDNTLFQLLIEQAVARSRRAGVTIPYYVMTSDATHDETIEFFGQHEYFGLDESAVRFFRQGNMPAVDAGTGRLLLAAPGRLAISPDGHGGMLAALQQAQLLDDMRERGVEYLYYHQVDNPTAVVCDPVFLGFHVAHGSEMSTKVIAKRSAEERMGVVVDVDGQTQIIEYSDMPDDVAAMTDDSGELLHWAGSTAIHVFNRELLERLTGGELALPFHVAHKQVEFIDRDGQLQQPKEPNAYKFERFIFDALTHARGALVLEADRAAEFSPVKNASGADSPETSRRDMMALHAGWLRQAGATLPEGADVEISPLYALDADELQGKISAGTEFDGPVNLRE